MIHFQPIALATLALLALAGCATPTERVVLLPSQDGRPAAVEITASGGSKTIINQPYAEARVAQGGEVKQGVASAKEVETAFAAALGARPPSPERYTVYFVQGTDELRADAEPVISKALDVIAAWPAPEVFIIGHTDTRGASDFNDELSEKRAARVAERLAERFAQVGVQGGLVSVAGRGEREPAVATDDEVDEPLNRRVVIEVR